MLHLKSILPALAAAMLVLAACSPKVRKPVAAADTPAPAVHYTAAQLEEGRTIYTNNCGKCHKLFQPAQKSLSKWENVLPRMIKKAKLSEEQGNLVRAYVMSGIKKEG